ncbi:MAG: NUDIX domain-containing protein [Patescibacteria group bacterium]
MEPKLFIATKAFIVHQGKVLILREAGSYSDGSNAGRYDVPGGRLKPGERFDEALRREVKEETGLEVTIGQPIAVNEWRLVVRGEPWQIVGIFFVCEASSDVVRLSEDHDAFEWIDPATYREHGVIDNLSIPFEAYLKSK